MKRSYNSGEKNPNWRGGRKPDGRGYILIYSPKHPFKIQNCVFEHRIVMEQWLCKNNHNHPALIEIDGELYLRPGWIPHHKNGITDDNRIENLELMTNSEHRCFHMLGEKNPNFGNHHPLSKKHRRGISLATIGEKNPMYGRHHSEETKNKIRNSEYHSLKHISEKHRKNISLAMMGERNPMFGKHRERDERGRFI